MYVRVCPPPILEKQINLNYFTLRPGRCSVHKFFIYNLITKLLVQICLLKRSCIYYKFGQLIS